MRAESAPPRTQATSRSPALLGLITDLVSIIFDYYSFRGNRVKSVDLSNPKRSKRMVLHSDWEERCHLVKIWPIWPLINTIFVAARNCQHGILSSLENFFQWYGKLVATHPKYAIFISVFVTFMGGLGLLRYKNTLFKEVHMYYPLGPICCRFSCRGTVDLFWDVFVWCSLSNKISLSLSQETGMVWWHDLD